VVLMHTLLGLDRDDSVSFLTKLGSVVQSKMNLQTHYLIMGTSSSTEDETPESSLPVEQVKQRNKEGQPIKILTQRQLLACIPSGLAIARGDW
jgi:hypothetical protein